MNIIKKLIIRNKLKTELAEVEKLLEKNNYEKMEYELRAQAYHPDAYAILYYEIEDKCGDLLRQKSKLLAQIRDLSGKNLFKKIDERSLMK